MRSSTLIAVFFPAASLVAGFTLADAAGVDGTLDPAYGPALTIQSTQTTLKGGPNPQIDFCTGRELDGGYAYIADGMLHLFLAGNMPFWWTLEGTTEWQPVDIFIDSKPGGQNQLSSNNPTIDSYYYDLKTMSGLTFDPGFEADYWLCLGSNNFGYPRLYAYYAELPSSGGGSGAFLGNTMCGGPGTLSGGTNPFGLEVTVDDSNKLGVGAGCGTASGADVVTGVEWSIPLAAIGNPEGCIKVCAFLSRADHAIVFNQVLGPLPPGTCDLGTTSAVNFGAIAGDQFFSICGAPVPAQPTSWGRLKANYR